MSYIPPLSENYNDLSHENWWLEHVLSFIFRGGNRAIPSTLSSLPPINAGAKGLLHRRQKCTSTLTNDVHNLSGSTTSICSCFPNVAKWTKGWNEKWTNAGINFWNLLDWKNQTWGYMRIKWWYMTYDDTLVIPHYLQMDQRFECIHILAGIDLTPLVNWGEGDWMFHFGKWSSLQIWIVWV